jgi:hypothetical protein
MDWLSKEIGVAYPWKSYSNTPVQDFMFGDGGEYDGDHLW